VTVPSPLDLHRENVRPEWIDYNGHMNVAYYVVAFDHAHDAFLEFVGLDRRHREERGGTAYAVVCRVTYQRELKVADPLRFTVQLLDYDEQRVHFFHRMYHAEEGYLAATAEWVSLHVDMRSRQSRPMPADTVARLAEIHQSHRDLPCPPEIDGTTGGLARNPA
jgi:acyl-CoA thioester hydrolase